MVGTRTTLAGDDYVNLNYSESLQLLADEKSPFFIGPSIAFQWAASYFTDDKAENHRDLCRSRRRSRCRRRPTRWAALVPCPSTRTRRDSHKDEAARIIDMMMNAEFMQEMTAAWPGYWGTPLKDLSTVDTSEMGYLSSSFVDVVKSISDAVNNGNFGYYDNMFCPPATQTADHQHRGSLVRHGFR